MGTEKVKPVSQLLENELIEEIRMAKYYRNLDPVRVKELGEELKRRGFTIDYVRRKIEQQV